MRRLWAISAFALFLAVPVWAQHGGGHAGGGHGGGGFGGHAGFGGGHSSGFSGSRIGGGRISGGMRSGSVAPRAFNRPNSLSQRSYSRSPYLHNGFRGSNFRTNRFRTFGFRNFGFRNNCYGYACRGFGYPWAYGGYYDPYWLWDSGSNYDQDYEQDRATANEMNQQSLEEQQMRRQEEADGDQDSYARSAPPRRPAQREAEGAPVLPPTVLVFRDQHKQEIQNYAIVGQTLWDFAPARTEKIPLSDLDLPATTKANDDRGLTFRIPAPGEGQ
jgi:hypothetical protein